jgi:hypothetical protein
VSTAIVSLAGIDPVALGLGEREPCERYGAIALLSIAKPPLA